MALDFFDGLDDYGTVNSASFNSVYISGGSQLPNLAIAGAFGGTALGNAVGDTISSQWQRTIKTPGPDYTIGGRLIFQGSNASYGMGHVLSDTSGANFIYSQILTVNGVSTVSIIQAGTLGPTISGGTVLATAAVPLLNNVWYEMETELVVGISGSAVVKINGNAVLSFTGNTKGSAGSNVGFAGVWIGGNNVSFPPGNVYWDDLYGLDSTGSAPYNTFLTTAAGAMGPRVYTFFPSANSAPLQWTPLSGSNFSEVNNPVFQGDLAGVSTGTVGNQDLYAIPEQPTTIGTVLAVQTSFVGREDDAGPRQIGSLLKSGASTHSGAPRGMVESYFKYFDIYLNDPDTDAPWNPDKFNTPGTVFVGVDCVE